MDYELGMRVKNSALGRWLLGLGVLIVAAAGMVWTAWQAGKDIPLEEQTVAVRGPVAIGIVLPLSGQHAERGAQLRATIEYAISEINTAGGVHGFDIDVVWKDSACTETGARSAVDALVDEEAVRVIVGGGVCTAETEALNQIVQERQVLLVTSAGVGQHDSASTSESFVFSLGVPVTHLATTSAAYAFKDLQAREAFIVRDPDDDFESAFATSFSTSFGRQGGSVVGTYSVVRQTHRASTDPLTSLQPNIDVVVLAVADPIVAQAALTSLKSSGSSAKVLASASLFDAALPERLDQYEGVFFARPDNGIKQAVFDDLIKHVRGEPQVRVARPVDLALTYSAIYVLRDAFLSVGLDPVRIREYFAGLSRWNGGAITNLTFDEQGVAVRDVLIQQVKDGKVVTVKRY